MTRPHLRSDPTPAIPPAFRALVVSRVFRALAHRRALLAVVATLLAACATATPGTGAAPEQEPAAAPLAWLASDEVLVLPLQEVELPLTGEAGTFDDMSPVTVASVRQRFDDRLRAIVEPQVPPDRWVWPQSLAALRVRNPTVMPDPARLTMRGLRPGMPSQTQLGQELGSELRALLAVSGARRYVLLPFRLVVRRDAASGASGYAIHMLVIDTRRAIVARAVSDSRDRVGSTSGALEAAVTGVAAMLIARER